MRICYVVIFKEFVRSQCHLVTCHMVLSIVETLEELFKAVASAHHISPADWAGLNSGSTGPTDEMSLLTLEHLRLPCEPLITNRTLGYSAGDVVSVGSAHQAQDVQVSLPGDGLQVSAVSVHSVKIHPRSVDKAACHLYLVVLEAVHHWSVSIRVLDVPVVVHSPVSTE